MKTYPRKLPLLPLALGLLLLLNYAAQAEASVSNVSAVRTPRTKRVQITYDAAVGTPTVTVSLEVRDGDTALPVSSISGHIGAGVPTGAGRSIASEAGADWNGNLATLTYTVTAEDGVGIGPAPDGFVLVESGTLASFYNGICEVSWGEWKARSIVAVRRMNNWMKPGARFGRKWWSKTLRRAAIACPWRLSGNRPLEAPLLLPTNKCPT